MAEISIHPAALLFPMMGEQELSDLADDIAANGLLEPVVLYHGEVLDGRNRLKACELADVEPRFVEVDGDLPSATIYVLSKNLHRRHLTTSQRAAIAADVVPLLSEEARKRQATSGPGAHGGKPLTANSQQGTAAKLAAAALQVGERTVYEAAKIKREQPEVHERIKNGEITVNEAAGKQESDRERRRLQAEDAAIEPYEPKTDHQKKLAEGQKDRMIRGLSTITGICRGLGEMDVRKALFACDEEERNTWIERGKDLASQLRAFSARLQKGF